MAFENETSLVVAVSLVGGVDAEAMGLQYNRPMLPVSLVVVRNVSL